MQLFKVRRKGDRNFISIMANNRIEAAMKFRRLMGSRNVLEVKDPQLMPGSLEKSRKIFRGR